MRTRLFAQYLLVGLALAFFMNSAVSVAETAPRLLYDLSFSTPPHIVGETVVVGYGDIPRQTPTHVVFGDPIVLPSQGPPEQHLYFDPGSPTPNGTFRYDQIRMYIDNNYGSSGSGPTVDNNLGPSGGYKGVVDNPKWITFEMDVTAYMTGDFIRGGMTVLFDTPQVRNIHFEADNTIRIFVPFGGSGIIGRYVQGTPVHLLVDLDLEAETWDIYLDGVHARSGSIFTNGLVSVRLNCSDTDEVGNWAKVDNLRIWDDGQCEIPQFFDFDIQVNGNGAVDAHSGPRDVGSTVLVTATPSYGAEFTGWTGDVPAANQNDNPLAILMDQDKSVTANFEQVHTLHRLFGYIAINPNNSPHSEFMLTFGDGTTMTRDNLVPTFWPGALVHATYLRVKPSGHGRQNLLEVDGVPFNLANADTIELEHPYELYVSVLHDTTGWMGGAMGQWYIMVATDYIIFSCERADRDGDGSHDWKELIAGTCPTNAADFFKTKMTHGKQSKSDRSVGDSARTVATADATHPETIKVECQSAIGRLYSLQTATSLTDPDGWTTVLTEEGTGGKIVFTHSPGSDTCFCRILVEELE